MSEKSVLIRDAFIVNEGQCKVGSILIRGQRIDSCYPEGAELPSADSVIEAEGMYCFPGVIDDQVHFREPGLTHKGDIATESEAALLGGVTSFMDMPNTQPQTVTLQAWKDKMRRAQEVSRANYSFYMGATNDNADVLQQLDPLHTPGVKVFMGASTGNMLVDAPEALRQIFSRSPLLIAVHSEDEQIISQNKQAYKERYGDDPDVQYHPEIRSREACYACTDRAVRLAKETGARLHVLHLSTADELEFFANDEECSLGHKQITAEVCVHHLWFSDEDYERLGTRIKWNPAVKGKADRDALRKALRERRVDIVATDHAPHLLSEKEGGALRAASGGPLVQHSLVMMLEMAQQGLWDFPTVAEFMCHRPAQLFGVRDRGYIRAGYYADLVLLKPDSPWHISTENIRSKCGWSPLEGQELSHRVWYTILNGTPVVVKGQLDTASALNAKMALEFDHQPREIKE